VKETIFFGFGFVVRSGRRRGQRKVEVKVKKGIARLRQEKGKLSSGGPREVEVIPSPLSKIEVE
jgi:hypothetical protein